MQYAYRLLHPDRDRILTSDNPIHIGEVIAEGERRFRVENIVHYIHESGFSGGATVVDKAALVVSEYSEDRPKP